MEIEGIKNICPTKPRSNEATITAPTTTAASSLTKASACWRKVNCGGSEASAWS